MKFAIITHVNHKLQDNGFFAYSPYVREMNIWLKHVDDVEIVAPLEKEKPTSIDLSYQHDNIRFSAIKSFNIIGIKNKIKALYQIPHIFFTVFKAMRRADHIHLRCPGNIGLIGCFAQIFFPHKFKTAKYAGNWDPNAQQPFSYKLQKWILSNTFLTKNMQVLVYGNWPNQSNSIKPFFTASYLESAKKDVEIRKTDNVIKMLFVGTLTSGKRPIYGLQLVENLVAYGFDVTLDIYGEGIERENLQRFITEKKLVSRITMHGNQTSETVERAYQNSHFLILPSQSEGWPKVVAEAMFWGCVPVATAVSCVSDMLQNESQGLLLKMDLEKDADRIKKAFKYSEYEQMALKAKKWSRKYTLDYLESEIVKILKKV